MPENYISKVKLPGDETTYDIRAYKTAGIYYAQVDSTSTSTNFTATIPDLNIDAYYDGLTVLLYNGKVTSAENFTININGLGAKPSYSNMALGNPVTPTNPTRDTTIFNINYAMLFTYNSTRVSGGCWICYRGYDANTNTIGYQLRSNNTTMPTTDKFYRYRLLFTSADHKHWVPANTSTSTNATSKRDTIQRPIDPFGEIVWYGTTTAIEANANVTAAQLWQEYYGSYTAIGYSFNRTGAAPTMTANRPIFIKCAPQSDGSAIIDADTPYVQALPNSEDGKIYIFLGRAYNATNFEILMNHPVYYYKDGAIRLWSNAAAAGTVTNIATGTGLTGGPITSTGTISHADTSTQASSTNSGRTYIQSVGLDDFGHVTSLSTATETVTDTNTTYTLSGGLSSHKFTSTLTAGGSGSGTSTAELTLAAGSNVSLTDDTTNKKITIAATDTTYTFANGTNSFTVTPSGGSAQTVTITPSVDASSQLTGIVPLTNGGTGISASSWYSDINLRPHFEIVYNEIFLGQYFGPLDGVTDVNSALASEYVKLALQTVIPIRLGSYLTGSIIGTATIMTGTFVGALNTFYILFPDALTFGSTVVNGFTAELAYDSDEGLYFNPSTMVPNQPYFWNNADDVVHEGMGDIAIGSSSNGIYWNGSGWRTTDAIPSTPADIGAAPLSHSHTSDQITRYTTDATIATNDKLGIFDASDSNKLKSSSITFDTTETDTYLRRDGTWATPSSSGGSRIVYTAYCDDGEVGSYQGTITLDDSKTGADVIADIESGNQVVIQVEDVEANTYEFTYSGARDNSTYVFTYVAHNSTNSQTALIITAATVTLKQSAYMELVSNRVSSITSSSLTTTYPNTKTVYNAISGGAISHYKLSTMDIEVSANYQTITINDIVGGFDCAVGDIVIGRNGNYGHIVSWSTSANPHSGTILYDGYLDDQIWGKSSSNGVYYPLTLDSTNINDGSVVVGMKANVGGVSNVVSASYSNFILMSGNSVAITAAAANSTSYSISNASGWALGDGSVDYVKQLLFYSEKAAGAQSPTAATLSGTTLTLTFASSLNPTAQASYLWYGSKSQNAGAVLIGAGISANSQSSYSQGNRVVNNGSYSLTIGQNMFNSGPASIVTGLRANNSGTGSAVFGDRNVNVAKYALIAGQGHNTTQYGSDTVAAVGKYSSISSDTAFAVGNGTDDSTRSNAFVVHSDGRATVGAAPINNMDVATKKYVDDNAGGGGDSVWVESNDVAYYPDTTSPTMSIDSTNDVTTINGDVVINSTDATFANAQSLKFAAASDKDCQFALTSKGTNMDVGWDWSTGDGAGLGLRSKRFSNNPGGFALYAKSTTSDEKRLEGKVNGVLTWNSRRVVTSTNGSAVGGTTQPVYIDSNGYPQLVTQMDTSKLMNPPIEISGIGDPTYRPLINNRRANHLAFLPASQIIIEQTTDGGTTWVDAGISDGAKINLFSETRASTVYLPLVNGQVSSLGGLRITFTPINYAVPSGVAETDKYSYWRRPDAYDTTASYAVGDRVYVSTNNYAIYTCKTAIAAPAGTFNSTYWTASSNTQERYFSLQNMYFWLSVANAGIGIGVKYQVAKGNAPDTWVDIFDSDSYNTAMTGWSGGNCIKFANTVIGGSLGQTGNYWNCRLTFFPRTTSGGSDIASGLTGKPFIQEIRGFGDSWWTTINASSAYASIDHLYKWDYLKNATFPAKITVGSAPTADMDVATKKYVDDNAGGGGSSNEYILEAPATLYVGASLPINGTYQDFQDAVTAMQAGKKVYLKIRAEQPRGSLGSSSDYIYQLSSGYDSTGFNFCWWDYFSSSPQLVRVTCSQIGSSIFWSISADALTPASGVSF